MSTEGKRRIVLGVTGGIAAYKSAELVRRLLDHPVEVRVVMTAGAREFVTPLTFQAVSGNPVHTSLLDPEAEAGMGHIELARWAELVLVAPASADFMARLAAGMADDLLSTLCLATEAPVMLAPAMNRVMWANSATQANARLLEQRGVALLGPGEGSQACGEMGAGRMVEVPEIVEAALESFGDPVLKGVKVLITAGPTREDLDPVRYISNRSSGKMGMAVAAAAARAGAEVTVVCGPSAVATPHRVERVDVESAREMHEQVMARAPKADIFVATAAVADYRPSTVPAEKIKKAEERMQVELVRNPDILREVAALENGPFTVGFAAETHRLAEHADEKRRGKGLDMIAANWVGRPEGGFDREENALEVSWEGGSSSLPQQSKAALAAQLVDLIAQRYYEKNKTEDS